MKRKRLVTTSLLISCSLLCGCTAEDSFSKLLERGKESIENVSSNEDSQFVQNQIDLSVLNANEARIQELLFKEQSSALSEDEWLELAKLYSEEGYIKDQRDTLEDFYRLKQDPAVLEMLSKITVNLEEEEQIRELVESVYNDIVSDKLGDMLSIIGKESWMETCMPNLYEGKRVYYSEKDGAENLVIEVGYTKEKVKYTNIFAVYKGKKDSFMSVSLLGNDVRLLLEESDKPITIANAKNGSEERDFEQYSISLSQGLFIKESGKIKGGKPVDGVSVKTAQFDDYNKTLEKVFLEQETLSYNTFLSADSVVEISNIPTIKKYTVKENRIVQKANVDTENMKVRVYDGKVQVYSNNMWITLGEVEEYVEKDPFKKYSDQAKEVMSNTYSFATEGFISVPKEEVNVADSNEGQSDNSSSAASSKPANSQTQKPAASSQTPAVQVPVIQTPIVVPTPQAPSNPVASNPTPAPDPTPAPAPDPTPTPTPTPTPDPTPTPTPDPPSNPTPDPPSGGDSGGGSSGGSDGGDIWSPDLD